jgi:hypothetical protein
MHVSNIHEREFDLSSAAVGSLIDSLASSNDRLWPDDKWPPMRFDRALAVGARGGHGPIRYSIEEYQPSRLVRFRFRAPRGFDGTHRYEVVEQQGRLVLRHVLEMHTSGLASLSWPLLFQPLHDALIEDSLDKAARSLGNVPRSAAQWSTTVRILRYALRTLRRVHSKKSSAG